MNDVLKELKWRGLIDNMTSPEVAELLKKPITVYAGFDPTSESLQIGNYVTIKALSHFQRCGHSIVALIGGATGMIGDPSGKNSEREFLSSEKIKGNIEGIRENLSRLLDFNNSDAPVILVDNNQWLGNYSFTGFIRDIGKHLRMGTMLGKESVRARLGSDTGMSFAEFSYQALQAYDFLELYERHSCILQLGGSDQWGNIVAGVDLVKKLRAAEVYGVTIPLVCDSSGQKFGKSEGNAVYLNSDKTSFYDFYQFFMRTDDSDVIRFLKIFTFLTEKEINVIEEKLRTEPEKRIAQQRLAEEMTLAVHGIKGLDAAKRATDALFGKPLEGMTSGELLSVFADVPSSKMPRQDVVGVPFVDLAYCSGMCASKGQARRLIQSGGMYVNNKKIGAVDCQVDASHLMDDCIVVLRSGKKNFYLLEVV